MIGGRALVLGFEGTALTAEERRIIRRVEPAGFTLVPRNIVDEAQLDTLVAELRSLQPRAILTLDGEGGRVDRLKSIVGPAPAADALARVPASYSRRAGKWMGEALRRFDFDLDLAPVVDLDRGLKSNALDRRCFGSSPRDVEAKAKAFIEGLEAGGVGACVKHFPGLGGAGKDTHFETSRIELPAAELDADLMPFLALADRAGAVMVGHAVYPALDLERRPATLSPAIATMLLRLGLSFHGALLSDDLEMEALSPHGSLAERGEAALVAGCDGLLFCRRMGEAPAIAARLGRARLRPRLEEAAGRLERLRRRLRALRRARRAPTSLRSVRTVREIRAGLAALATAIELRAP